VLNLHGFIGYFDSLKNNQYKLDVTAASDFKRTSALQNVSSKASTDGKNTTTSYFAPRYFDITDNPMMYGNLDVEEFQVGDIKIVLSVYSPNKVHTAKSLKNVVFKMMQAQKNYLGDVNATPRYDIYLYLSEGNADSPKGLSFTIMSENILKAPYKDQYTNVYQKGALIGMCIDILMREASNGNRGILSLMKELSNKYGKNKPFEDDALIAEIIAMTYPSVGEFLNTHVVGDIPINYNDFFEKAGLEIAEAQVEANYILMDGAPIVSGAPDKGIFFIDTVLKNSFWKEQGAQPNDVIKSINGKEVTLQTANAVLGEVFGWTPGKDIEVVLDRDGQEIIIKTTTTQGYRRLNAIRFSLLYPLNPVFTTNNSSLFCVKQLLINYFTTENLKVVPVLVEESTSIVPPILFIRDFTVYKPIPVPLFPFLSSL